MQEVKTREELPVAHIWKRLKETATGHEEPDGAFFAFRLYRDLSPASRSLNAVALALYRKTEPQAEEAPKGLVRQVEKWSAQWNWIFRVLAWDDEQDRIRREQQSERLKTVVAQQKQDCQIASHILMALPKKLIALAQSDPTLKSVSDQQLARDAQRVIRAFPDLQEAERTLFTPRPKRELERETAPESTEWEWGGVEVDENGLEKEGGKREAQEAPSWRDELWVRQVDLETGKPEPSRAFHAFTLFRDLPPHQRTLRQVTAVLRGTPETVRSGPSTARTRRREFVSATVESWSAKYQWKKRARAWDDEQDRVRRRAEQKEVERIRQEHGQQLMIARQGTRALMVALAKRIPGDEFFAGEDVKLVRSASESIPLISRLQEAERALYGDGTDYRERQVMRLSGKNVFMWGEVNCECGHPHSKHDQMDPNPRIMPCTIGGCACQKFIRPDLEAEAEISIVPSRGGLDSNLEISDRERTG